MNQPSVNLENLDQLRNTEAIGCQSEDGRLGRRILTKQTGAKFWEVNTWQGQFRPRGIDNSRMVDINSLRGQVLGLSARRGQGDGWTDEEGHSLLGRPPGRGGIHRTGGGEQNSQT